MLYFLDIKIEKNARALLFPLSLSVMDNLVLILKPLFYLNQAWFLKRFQS